MKEAFWGVLIIILGLLGVVIVNLFQNVTVDNDRVYYLIKESTEAASLDAIDLSYYRLNGTLRVVEDKFIENLTRRFAENVTVGDYVIVVEDLNEVPPKISLRVRSGVTSLRGEKFGIVNRVDAVLETKYGLEEVLDFLEITEEEWYSSISKTKIEIDSTGKNVCKVGLRDDEELSCMPGDLMFAGFSNSNLNKNICQDEAAKRNIERVANYKECECGKWVEKKESVYANPVRSGNGYNYTWNFSKTGEIRNIKETAKERVVISTCTTGINVMVPKNPDNLPVTGKNEPSDDNSGYIECPAGGIKIIKGTTVTLHPRYIPTNATNRKLTWTSSKTDILSIVSSNPSNSCVLNSTNSNCLSKATITALKEGTSTVTVKTTRGQTSTCKVTVWDGYPEEISCKDITVTDKANKKVEVTYKPSNAIHKDFTYSINKTDVATIDKNGEIKVKKAGEATITVKSGNGKTGTCKLTAQKEATKLSCSKTTIDGIGRTKALVVVPSPNNATTNLTYKSNNTNVARVDNKGIITAVNKGATTITVTDSISKKTVNCDIETRTIASNLICPTNFTATPKATILNISTNPSNATTNLTYKSNNPNVVTVDNRGMVTAKNKGNATITVTDSISNKTITCNIKATDGTIDNNSLRCSNVTINYSETTQINATYTPQNASKVNLEWSINNTNVAVIDKNTGKITGRNNSGPNEARVIVTVKETNTNLTATCTAIVRGKACASGSYPTKEEAENRAYCSSNQNKETTQTNGCYKTTCVCKYKTEEEAKNAITCTEGQSKTASKDTNNCYTASCISTTDPDDPKPPTPEVVGPVGTPTIEGCGPHIEENENVFNSGVIKGCDRVRDPLTNKQIGSVCKEQVEYNNAYKVNDTYGKCDCDKHERIVYCEGKRTKYYYNNEKPWYEPTEKTVYCSCDLNKCPGKYTKIEDCKNAAKNACGNKGLCSSDKNDCYSYQCVDIVWDNDDSSSGSGSSTTTKPSTGSGNGACFTAGTKVIGKYSTIDIDKVKVGDIVLSYNVDTNKNEYNKVLNVFVHKNVDERLYSLTINGNIIEVTENHRFYIKNGSSYDWIAVKDLKIGDKVMDKDGKYYTIDKMSYKTLNETVYNFEVENNHNYYVGEGILVHNIKDVVLPY